MAEDGAWNGIRKRGVLSTAGLIALFEIPEPERTQLLEERRFESIELTHPCYEWPAWLGHVSANC